MCVDACRHLSVLVVHHKDTSVAWCLTGEHGNGVSRMQLSSSEEILPKKLTTLSRDVVLGTEFPWMAITCILEGWFVSS